MRKTVIAIALIATTATVPTFAPAFAKGHTWQVGNDSMHIYYADIDMTTAAGRALYLTRVERAATRLCRDSGEPRACTADTVKATARLPGQAPLQVALQERSTVRLAAR